jgi:hypothetical protein
MKLFAVSAMSAVAMANDLESIWKTALAKPSSVEALKVNEEMMRSSGDDRNVMDLFTLSNIFEYGCWCHFGDSHLPRGPVMDTVDGYCNRWWNSKDCIRIDNNNAGTTCDLSMQYVDVLAGLTFPFGPGNDYPSLCSAANNGQHADAEEDACAIANCEVDAYFLRDTFTHMSFNHLNHSLSVSFGFDTDFTCRGLVASQAGTTAAPFAGTTVPPVVETTAAPVVETTGAPWNTWDCCGAFPDRFPYKPQGGDRACCNGATYNTLTLMCCPNGSTGAINSC